MAAKNKIILWLLKNTPVLLLFILFVFFGIVTPRFFQLSNLESIAVQASYIGVVAIGMTFVLLTGGIDLSVGANMYLSASVAGLLIQNFGVPVWLGLFIAILIGLAFGMINAFAIVKLNILPFIVTLSTMMAGRGLTLVITKSQAVPFPDSVTHIGSARIFGIPLLIVIYAAVVFLAYVFLKRTQQGRQIYAVGNDAEAAKKAGINTHKTLFSIYVISGILAALGGVIAVVQMGIINAGFGNGDEFDAISAAVLGGTSLFGGVGSVFPGTVIGTILIQTVQAGLVYLQVDLYIQPLVSAAIIFLAVFLDSLRNSYIVRLERRNIRVEGHVVPEKKRFLRR